MFLSVVRVDSLTKFVQLSIVSVCSSIDRRLLVGVVKPSLVSGLQSTSDASDTVHVSWMSSRNDKQFFYRVVLTSQWDSSNLVRTFTTLTDYTNQAVGTILAVVPSLPRCMFNSLHLSCSVLS